MPRWQNCITSAMLVAITALWNVVLSPTLTGIVGSSGATPPASNITTKFGACVRWASIAAAHGSPVPTATVLPSSSSRAAQQIISSIDVYGTANLHRGGRSRPPAPRADDFESPLGQTES